MPTQAFYCSLCCVFAGDAQCAHDHLKSNEHNESYQVTHHICYFCLLSCLTFSVSWVSSYLWIVADWLNRHHITPVFKSLLLLKIPERIEYKAISLTYNIFQPSQPTMTQLI